MPYHESTYSGDDDYHINCTGDCVVGDEVRFERAVFSGSLRRPTFDGFEMVTAKIVKDSYGRAKQQHTFTLETEDGDNIRIKGRNLYRNGVYRKSWEDESARKLSVAEKHQRGDAARTERRQRRERDIEERFYPGGERFDKHRRRR